MFSQDEPSPAGPMRYAARAGLETALDAYVARRIGESPVMLGAGEAKIDTEALIGRARLEG